MTFEQRRIAELRAQVMKKLQHTVLRSERTALRRMIARLAMMEALASVRGASRRL
jgi:hypothetical protein